MWILLMVVFSQPYQVDHIQLLGEYRDRVGCVMEQERAVRVYNDTSSDKVSFGCLKIGFKKTSNVSHETKRRIT